MVGVLGGLDRLLEFDFCETSSWAFLLGVALVGVVTTGGVLCSNFGKVRTGRLTPFFQTVTKF